jgi:hypothetical protein
MNTLTFCEDLSLDKPLHVIYKVILIANERVKKFFVFLFFFTLTIAGNMQSVETNYHRIFPPPFKTLNNSSTWNVIVKQSIDQFFFKLTMPPFVKQLSNDCSWTQSGYIAQRSSRNFLTVICLRGPPLWEFLATDPEVLVSILGTTRFSEK